MRPRTKKSGFYKRLVERLLGLDATIIDSYQYLYDLEGFLQSGRDYLISNLSGFEQTLLEHLHALKGKAFSGELQRLQKELKRLKRLSIALEATEQRVHDALIDMRQKSPWWIKSPKEQRTR